MNRKAIILYRQKYLESDLMVRMLLDDGCKRTFLAKGAVKSRRRFGGGALDPLNFVKISFQVRNASSLTLLNEVQIINSFVDLRSNLDRLNLALQMLNWVDRLGVEGETSAPDLFSLLGHSLQQVVKTADLEILWVQFRIKILYQQGVLEIQEWMRPFLANPLAEMSLGSFRHSIDSQQVLQLDRIMREYTGS